MRRLILSYKESERQKAALFSSAGLISYKGQTLRDMGFERKRSSRGGMKVLTTYDSQDFGRLSVR